MLHQTTQSEEAKMVSLYIANMTVTFFGGGGGKRGEAGALIGG